MVPCIDVRYEREEHAVPRCPGHDTSAISGLEMTTEGGDIKSYPKRRRAKWDELRALERTTMEILRAREQRSVPLPEKV